MSLSSFLKLQSRARLLYGFIALCLLSLVAFGAMANKGWLPRTDPLSGKRTGWFGKELPKNASSSWNPLAAPSPNPTPQLSKEYIYAGSRLLAVEDANANAAPPADLAVWRPSTGYWYVLGGPGSQQTSYGWGLSTDTPVPGDYDGDGKTDFSIYRPSTGEWHIVFSGSATSGGYTFGLSSDTPMPADYDGDGKTDAAVYREDQSTGLATFYVRQSSTGNWWAPQLGLSTDEPAAADYDGDGRADIGVWRPSNQTFYSVASGNGGLYVVPLGQSGDKIVSADYDGDGKADYAVKSGNNWIIRKSSNSQTDIISWQQSGDVPVQNDYDGDGKVDIAVWRSVDNPTGTLGHWYIRQSASGNSLRDVHWGTTGDTPVPAFYRR